jgi:hypothetical protein
MLKASESVGGDLKPDETVLADLALAGDSASDLPPETKVADLVMEPPAAAAVAFVPKTCINCGASAGGVIQVLGPGRFGCTRCQHQWTLAEEQAPFRHNQR